MMTCQPSIHHFGWLHLMCWLVMAYTIVYVAYYEYIEYISSHAVSYAHVLPPQLFVLPPHMPIIMLVFGLALAAQVCLWRLHAIPFQFGSIVLYGDVDCSYQLCYMLMLLLRFYQATDGLGLAVSRFYA